MRRVGVICGLLCLAAPCLAEEADPRQAALERAGALAERFGLLEDKELAYSSMLRLGETVCRYDIPAGAGVFRRAAAALQGAGLTEKRYEDDRAGLLIAAGSCDAHLQEEIRNSTVSPDTDRALAADTTLHAAQSVMEKDPARAAELAASTLEALPAMDGRQAAHLAEVLAELHGNDSKRADGLFLDALDGLQADPSGAWTALQSLGNYVFDATSSTEVDDYEVLNWTARRKASSDEAAMAYLKAVTAAMTASAGDDGTSRFRSTVARQLQPYASALAPELLPTLKSAVRPEDVTLDVASTLFRQTGVDEALAGMARSADPHERLQGNIFTWREHWRAGRFEEARAVAARISDEAVRASLSRLVDYGRVAATVQEDRLEVASAMTGKLQPGFHQGVLYLAISSAYLKKSDLESARSSLNLAWDAAGHADATKRPHLLAAVSGVQARADPDHALDTLAEAVRAYNDALPVAQPPKRSRRTKDLHAIPQGFLEYIRGDDGRVYASVFSRIAGVECLELGTALAQFAALDLDRVDASVAGIRDEQLLAEAQIRACELRLRKAFSPAAGRRTQPVPEPSNSSPHP